MWLDHVLRNGPESGPLLILAHGAGAPMDTPFMQGIAEGVAERGFAVLRFEFPYMAQRREGGKKRPPERAPKLEQQWLDIIARYGDKRPLLIGGKSMGGRIASMVADRAQVKGLVCLGYPFHPPGKPEKTRTEHLAELKTPTLMVQGTRDTMGNATEVPQYQLAETIRLKWLEDGDHSFKPRKASGFSLEQHLVTASEEIAAFAASIAV